MVAAAVDRSTFVQGRSASYSVAGSGLPVVMLHGWALAQHTYRDVIETIAAQGCQVIAPAMPGFGGTADLPGKAFSIRGYAQWVADFLDGLELTEPAVVVGHSFGGGVAVQFAHDFRSRVRSLVLVNSIGGSSWRSGRTSAGKWRPQSHSGRSVMLRNVRPLRHDEPPMELTSTRLRTRERKS